MTQGYLPNLIYLLAVLVLVSSSFWGRRINLGAAARMALVWLGIFLVLFFIVDNRHAIGRALGLAQEEQQRGDPVDPARIA